MCAAKIAISYILLQYLINNLIHSFLIGNDGVIYEGTGWYVRGAHTYGYNQNGTGIAFIGNFMGKPVTNLIFIYKFNLYFINLKSF